MGLRCWEGSQGRPAVRGGLGGQSRLLPPLGCDGGRTGQGAGVYLRGYLLRAHTKYLYHQMHEVLEKDVVISPQGKRGYCMPKVPPKLDATPALTPRPPKRRPPTPASTLTSQATLFKPRQCIEGTPAHEQKPKPRGRRTPKWHDPERSRNDPRRAVSVRDKRGMAPRRLACELHEETVL